jgi:Tol biopolymer transport system component
MHNLSTGDGREIYRTAEGSCVWASASGKIVCVTWGKAASEIVAVTPGSGEVQRLGEVAGRQIMLRGLSHDEKAVYYTETDDKGLSLLRWDVAQRQTMVLDRVDALSGVWLISSMDERWLVHLTQGRLEIKPASGGRWTQVVASMKGGQFDVTPDGNWIYFHGAAPYGEPGLYRVGTSGGPPERLGNFPVRSFSGTMRISPDGRKVMASVFDSSNGFEFWSLENFLPTDAKR